MASYEQKTRERDPRRLPARVRRDRDLRPRIRRVWEGNDSVYGVWKVRRQMNREGVGVSRYTVGCLMRKMGLQGAVRGRKFKTTIPDENRIRPLDLVQRDSTATRPNQPIL